VSDWGGSPYAVRQFHAAEFVERNAAPVIRDPAASARFHSLYRTDSAPVCSAPASAGRTGGGDRDTQPRWAVCSPRPCAQPGKHPTATPLRPLTLSDYPRRRITLDSSNIYNTVILDSKRKAGKEFYACFNSNRDYRHSPWGITARWPALATLSFGLIVVYFVGFSQFQRTHNATHDTRHANGFPCH
jgi:cobalt transporter subunit CbtB